MKELQIFDSNIEIAKFMDCYDEQDEGSVYDGGPEPTCRLLDFENEVLYHKSWDWLIPVIVKINSIDLVKLPVYAFKSRLEIHRSLQKPFKIEDTYRYVVNFVTHFAAKT